MEIRQFTPADAAQVLVLWRDAGLILSRSDTPEGLVRKLSRDPDLFLVAEERGAVVGIVMGAYDGRRGWVYHLAVAPSSQRSGLGSRLVTEVEERLRSRGCDKVNLLIEPTNAAVQGFYERLGYARDELIFMEKWLS